MRNLPSLFKVSDVDAGWALEGLNAGNTHPSFQVPQGIVWGPMAAGATPPIAPPVLLMLILQKWMVRGLPLGATKG